MALHCCLLRLRHQPVSARRVLTSVTLLFGLSTVAWLYWTHTGSAGFNSQQPAAPAADSLIRQVADDATLWQSDSSDHLPSSESPGLVPLDVAALRRNFQQLKRVALKFSGSHGARINQLMRHREPVFSTADWRLHTPKGTKLSIESVQRRAVLSSSEGHPVPNVAHYILPFRDATLQFHHVVSMLSCIHVMRPQLLILWYAPGRMVRGKWWARLRSNLTSSEWESRIVMATRPMPEFVYSMPVTSAEHLADVIRMEALLTFGGAYFDLDAVVLKPLDPLRRHQFAIGREHSEGLCNGVLLTAPNSTFLAMWHTAYQVFNSSVWDAHSVRLPHRMHRQFPDLCHVEERSLVRPSWKSEELRLIYGLGEQRLWNWRAENFVLHLWFRWYNSQHDMNSIKKVNSMYGEVCRFILFGTSDLL